MPSVLLSLVVVWGLWPTHCFHLSRHGVFRYKWEFTVERPTTKQQKQKWFKCASTVNESVDHQWIKISIAFTQRFFSERIISSIIDDKKHLILSLWTWVNQNLLSSQQRLQTHSCNFHYISHCAFSIIEFSSCLRFVTYPLLSLITSWRFSI